MTDGGDLTKDMVDACGISGLFSRSLVYGHD